MTDKEAKRRSLQWERGLKCGNRANCVGILCRSLQWERGLKYFTKIAPVQCRGSRSLQWERGLK